MKLVFLIGNGAVGKMTVGQELMKITGLRLFHNHMTIELVSKFFSYGTDAGKRLVHSFRQQIFDEVLNSDLEGLIFTFVWAFNSRGDWDYINDLIEKFRAKGSEIYLVELEADLGIDSIKRVEIFADVVKKLGIPLTPDQTEELSALSTVTDIAAYLSKLV